MSYQGKSPAKILDLHAPGATVLIGGDVRATVTGVLIRNGIHVQYECSWWDGRSHYCKWICVTEVAACDAPNILSIGFK